MKKGYVKYERTRIAVVRMYLVMGLVLLGNLGCSAVMAAKQPGKKDLSVLDPGTPRSHVIAELGAPAWSGERGGNKIDVFAFKQGYSKGARAGRAFFHAAADVFTLGLWEVVGTPIESVASGTDVKAEVTYDGDERVKSVEMIEQKEAKDAENTEQTNSRQEDPAKATWE